MWFTGLSGSGKTTLAQRLDRRLWEAGHRSFLLDGDSLRLGLNADLGFEKHDRDENVRRFAEVARLFADAGVLTLLSVIAPFEAMRNHARERIGADRFVLVYLATPLEICEARDAKGLYKRARAGQLKNFTGIDSPYEEPTEPDLRLAPEHGDPPAMVDRVLALIEQRGFLRTEPR